MKLDAKSGLQSVANRVIAGDKKRISKQLSKEDRKTFEDFLKSEDDFRVYRDSVGMLLCVRILEDAEKMRVAGAKIRESLPKDVEQLALFGDEAALTPVLEGLLLASYQFNKYFSDAGKRNWKLNALLVEEEFSARAMEELEHIRKAVYWARDMVNEPVSYLTAVQFAEEMTSFAKDCGVAVTVLEKTQIESLKMGGLLAVNQGSVQPPTFTILEYKPKKAKNKKPIVLVGKGVVYDTGGLSLKPTPNSMDSMKSDMGGAACVVGATMLAAMQQLPLHIITLVPATDNRPGLNAYAPGDIVRMFNGKTVEVLNTDAEGRMILADALSYAAKYDPELVIDAATLTGAAHRAVGEQASAVMGNAEERYFDLLEKAGYSSHERVVRFPFWEEYGEEMKSSIADLNNLGGPTAGMITAGKFLEHFVEAPYIHMDIAGPAWLTKNNAYRTKGGSGVGVRLLYHFLKNYA